MEETGQTTATTVYPNTANGQVTLKIGSDQLLNTRAVLSTVSGQTKQIIYTKEKRKVVPLEDYSASV